MKIAFVGAHCTGKTTAVWYVGSTLKQNGYNSVEILPELARICPYPINEQAKFATNLWLIFEQIKMEHMLATHTSHAKETIILSDRSVYDSVAYANAMSREKAPLLATVAKAWAKVEPYDLLLFFPISWDLIADGKRSTDVEWQRKVDDELKSILFGTKENIKVVQGKNHVERCDKAYKIVHSFLKEKYK